RVVTGPGDHNLRIWDVDKGTLVGRPTGACPINVSTCSLDGLTLASGSLDRTIRVWRTD
ncbi:uncharacterized protein EDB93DRAFT_1041882, partial [Suillus bovinus]|uniref:uncharacterized protein n=1 Tax=Suillus bovinus TaxID=48563 RepID=UPI001B8656CA